MLTKFKKGLKIKRINKDTNMSYWEYRRPQDVTVEEEQHVNGIARKYIKEHGEELERIMGREVSSK